LPAQWNEPLLLSIHAIKRIEQFNVVSDIKKEKITKTTGNPANK
jgi:hypothetical protein